MSATTKVKGRIFIPAHSLQEFESKAAVLEDYFDEVFSQPFKFVKCQLENAEYYICHIDFYYNYKGKRGFRAFEDWCYELPMHTLCDLEVNVTYFYQDI